MKAEAPDDTAQIIQSWQQTLAALAVAGEAQDTDAVAAAVIAAGPLRAALAAQNPLAVFAHDGLDVARAFVQMQDPGRRFLGQLFLAGELLERGDGDRAAAKRLFDLALERSDRPRRRGDTIAAAARHGFADGVRAQLAADLSGLLEEEAQERASADSRRKVRRWLDLGQAPRRPGTLDDPVLPPTAQMSTRKRNWLAARRGLKSFLGW